MRIFILALITGIILTSSVMVYALTIEEKTKTTLLSQTDKLKLYKVEKTYYDKDTKQDIKKEDHYIAEPKGFAEFSAEEMILEFEKNKAK